MPPARLSILFARQAPLAVILRTGPVRATRMILWDTDRDTFTDGQWVRHKIYAPRCDLSPDGRYLIYFAYRHHDRTGRHLGGFTAISRPPWFRALAMLPFGSTWGGGGLFPDRRHVHIQALQPHEAGTVPLPRDLTPVFLPPATGGIPDRFLLANGQPAPIDPDALHRLRAERPWHDPASVWQNRELPPLPAWCMVRDGCLFRRGAAGAERLLRDFNPMRFEPLDAPYD